MSSLIGCVGATLQKRTEMEIVVMMGDFNAK